MSLPWISPLLEQDFRTIIYSLGTPKTVPKNTVLISENEQTNSLYFVKSGLVAVSAVNPLWGKNEITALFCFPNTMTDDGKLVFGIRMPLKTIALAKSVVIQFDINIIYKKFKTMNKHMIGKFKRHGTGCLKAITDAMTIIASYSANERIKFFLSSIIEFHEVKPENGYYTLPIKISRLHISHAVFLAGMTIDRIFSEWFKSGFIKRNASSYLQVQSDFLNVQVRKNFLSTSK